MPFSGIDSSVKLIQATINNALTGATWNIDGNGKVFNTPTVGSSVIVGGSFATDMYWTKGTGWTIAGGVATGIALAPSTLLYQLVSVVDTWYTITYTINSINGNFRSRAGTTLGASRTSAGAYTDVLRAVGTVLAGFTNNVITDVEIDSVNFRPTTLSTMFATKNLPSTLVGAKLNTHSPNSPMGVVGWLDSAGSPANFILAYYDGEAIKMDKCVSGVYTNLVSVTTPFVTDGIIELQKTPQDTFRVLYQGVQIGTEQTINDASIVNNTIFGLFSGSSGNLFSEFYLY